MKTIALASKPALRPKIWSRAVWTVFLDHGRPSWPLILVFLAVNGIVSLNAVLHEPRVGYDAARHLDYIGFLARGALPVGPDYFDPPLYYVVPALIRAVGTRLAVAAKGAQYLNVLCSLGVTYTLVRLAELARPGDMLFRTIALGLLGMLPVYYKTFAFVRPEPLLAALAALATWQAAHLAMGIRLDLRRAALLGLVCGLLALTRQQGLLVVVAAVIFVGVAICRRQSVRAAFVATCVVVMTALVVGGWFYVHLYRVFGTPAAISRPLLPLALTNKPREFYLGVGLPDVFREPLRPAFDRQVLPKFYSEIWGDHYRSFLVYSGIQVPGGHIIKFTNRPTMGPYLGWVNLVSLVPTVVFMGGIALGFQALFRTIGGSALADRRAAVSSLALVVVLASAVAYLVFLIRIPEADGDTIKASYLLHVLPMTALLAADLLRRLRDLTPRAFVGLVIALAVVAVHNSGTYVTRYTPLGG